MDLDFALICKLSENGTDSFQALRKRGFTAEHLQGPAKKVFGLIEAHQKKHNKLPTLAQLGRKLDVEIERPEDLDDVTLDEIRDEIVDRHRYNRLVDAHEKVAELLEGYRPADAEECWLQATRKMQEDGYGDEEMIVELADLGEEVIAHYLRVKSGEIGIVTPWGSMDALTLGWQPEDLILIVARMGIGKTWCLLMMAKAAYEAGHKLVFFTTEISQRAIALRLFSLFTQHPYNDIRKATLGEFAEEKFFEGVRSFTRDGRFLIAGGQYNLDMDMVDRLVERHKPDVIFLDGLYLFIDRALGKVDRSTLAAHNIETVKRLLKRYGIPGIASMQFNRKVKEDKEKSATVDKIAMTDVAGWTADYIFALIQTRTMRMDNTMLIQSLKVREDERIRLKAAWDFAAMNFAEIETTRESDEAWDRSASEKTDEDVSDLGGKGSLRGSTQQEVNF